METTAHLAITETLLAEVVNVDAIFNSFPSHDVDPIPALPTIDKFISRAVDLHVKCFRSNRRF